MRCKRKFKQPDIKDWIFVRELSAAEPRIFYWTRKSAAKNEADLSGGVSIVKGVEDRAGVLQTAYDDLEKFFRESGLPGRGEYEIITESAGNSEDDSFEMDISKSVCRVKAGNAEGIRRGVYHLEDMLLGADGPFLKTGSVKRVPWLRDRISRCFFGPIKRPPVNRDEMLDDVDYYPDEYLNRLAHEGINGLWLTVTFKDLCKTSFTPENGRDAEKRLDKLRRTADKCLRYGIKTYIFCIEPAAWLPGDRALPLHPELGGANDGNVTYFCPFSGTSQKYLYECVNGIFKAVPQLGGMINISHGERATTCLSSVSSISDKKVECPVCSGKKHWEILNSALSAMEKGMRDAAPGARLISWQYMPFSDKLAKWVFELPKHTPENVTLQFNFESGGEKSQLGKKRKGGDYWLSYTGPSENFKKLAETAACAGTAIAAKIQAGCSHEVATVPFVPVPALLYRKHKKMRELGVSGAMLCWYFGNYPGLMNKAAGMLAFEDFTKDEENGFLMRLARPDWGKHAGEVVRAWKFFARGYSNYPMSNMFQYYGPAHDGVVWPLYLYPAKAALAPTWQLGELLTPGVDLKLGCSGDMIGECLENHSAGEAAALCGKMAEDWRRGVETLKKLSPFFRSNPARQKDIGVAEALGIQFESAYNILRFYILRGKLFGSAAEKQKETLNEMRKLVLMEISGSERLAELCGNDSRLGFHSEAEGYKYFPDKLKWRADMLRSLLEDDFKQAEKEIAEGGLKIPAESGETAHSAGDNWASAGDSLKWRASRKDHDIHLELSCAGKGHPDQIFITLYSSSLEHPLIIDMYKSGHVSFSKPGCSREITETENGWLASVRIPRSLFQRDSLRLGVVRMKTAGGKHEFSSWGGAPMRYRLGLGMCNPAKTGVLLF
jgi:hypothetical protein